MTAIGNVPHTLHAARAARAARAVPLSEPIEPIERLAVFRGLVLGDVLCAVPALRALRARFARSTITFIGLPWARELMARLSCVDDFIEFPGWPGLPERHATPDEMQHFVQTMRARRFDLLVQLHGSGSIVNPLMAQCGARRVAGFVEPGGYCADPALHVPWPRQGHETQRLLRLTDHLGAAPQGTQLEFPLTDADRAELAQLGPPVGASGRYVCVHAGAQLPSRQWLAERFAAVADALAQHGHAVVLTGTAGEAERAAQIERAMRAPVVNLVGRTSLWTLGALLERAALLVSNDTGVVHVAAALGTPSVAVSSGGDVSRWAPADSLRHSVLWAETPCRPCPHRVCPTDHECAKAVDAHLVTRAALRTLRVAVSSAEPGVM